MSLTRRRTCVLILGLLAASANPARAQGSIEITPFIASFYALTSVNEQTDIPLTDFAGAPPGSIIRSRRTVP